MTAFARPHSYPSSTGDFTDEEGPGEGPVGFPLSAFRGEALAQTLGVAGIHFQLANALDAASLGAIESAPSLMVSSGFYEIVFDDVLFCLPGDDLRKKLSPSPRRASSEPPTSATSRTDFECGILSPAWIAI